MTKEHEIKFLELVKKGCTICDVEDFCDKIGISRDEAYHKIAEWYVPKQCKGCVNVEFYPGMFPCSSCSRIYKDRYVKKEYN